MAPENRAAVGAGLGGFQVGENFARADEDRRGQAREPRDLDAVAAIGDAWLDAAQEDQLVTVLGFSRATVLVLFLLEGILLALVAGAVGLLLAIPFSAVSMATNNWASFSAISFNFRIGPGVVIGSLLMSLFIGVVGSFFPALNAARAPVLDGLRKA